MNYYSHVLHFPDTYPFDRPEFRWTTFLSEFVAPLMKDRGLKYWVSYYGSFVRFRVLTDDYESLKPDLESLRDSLGLVDKGEEKDMTLVGDLGHARFLAPNSDSSPEKRAELVLNYLNSISLLLVDNLVKGGNYWKLETSNHNENPLNNNFESLAHLLGNMTQFQFDVEFGYRTPWMHPQPIQKFRCHL